MFHDFTLDGIEYTAHHNGPLLVISGPDGEMARARTVPLDPPPGPTMFVPDMQPLDVDVEEQREIEA